MGGLLGKVALITGASSGIGAALALEFARRGADVALLARRTDRLASLAAQIGRLGRRALPLACDVTRDGDVEQAVATTIAALGGVDYAVANAGFGVVGNVADLSIDDYRRQFETNFFGALRTIHAAIPAVTRRRGGIALIGSVQGFIALPGTSPYASSKFALRAVAEALWHELRPRGVAVTLISPGFVESELREVANDGSRGAAAPDPLQARLRMPADKAARQIVRAIVGRRRHAVITGHGKLLVLLAHAAPWLLRMFVRALKIGGRKQPDSRSAE